MLRLSCRVKTVHTSCGLLGILSKGKLSSLPCVTTQRNKEKDENTLSSFLYYNYHQVIYSLYVSDLEAQTALHTYIRCCRGGNMSVMVVILALPRSLLVNIESF